jgi:hypothetical protein
MSANKTGNPDEARARAEAKFKKQEHAKRESDKVWAERAAANTADDKHRAKLKALRLARDAGEKSTTKGEPQRPSAKRTSKR